MTARQHRRLEQKLALKAAKRASKAEVAGAIPRPAEPANPEAITATACLAGAPDRSETFTGRKLAVASSVSSAKKAANVANAQLSTGAVSEAGKAIVSQNATKHGLTGKFKVLPCESQFDFDQLLDGLLRSETPVDDYELEMVRQMAEALWLSRRCLRLQNACFEALESGTTEGQRNAQKSLTLYLRYQTTHDRTFLRYAAELRKRRNERARVERGFVSQKHKEAAERRRQELHVTRQAFQNTKQESQEIRNRLAAAKAEALELKNRARTTQQSAAAA